jgi:hypothetical protein
MYSQIFLVSSVREWVFADHCGQCGVGLHGFAKGVFWAAFFGVGIGQLERAELGCQAKNQPCFSGHLRPV